ncbi:MAG: dihydrofolate reductase [Pseudomonadota bacterium]
MIVSLIAALAQNRALGKNQQLLWHLPEDLRHFRSVTQGKTVIMGRKTWESLPEKFRPLPGRHNLVISRNPHYQAPGASLAPSLEAAIAVARLDELNKTQANQADMEVFIIGGAELYRAALPLAQRLYLTEIAQSLDGDCFFPPLPAHEWEERTRSPSQHQADLDFSFVLYERRR